MLVPSILNGCAHQSNYAPVNTGDVTSKPMSSPSPVFPNQLAAAKAEPKFYVVKKNETLYSISRFFNLDYRQVAQWNQLPRSFTIKVGQKIRLAPPATESGNPQTQSVKPLPIVIPAQKKPDSTAMDGIGLQNHTFMPLGNQPNLINEPPYKADNPKKSIEKQEPVKEKKSNISIDNETMLKLSFQWPIKGKIVKVFSDASNKGIDIAGEMGQEVGAAEDGEVVYSGQGPIGYGNLLIIKHNDLFLSAYANNSQLLVTEGQTVKKGEVIAHVGRAGSDKTSLHFEIRKNGKPVNPLKFLPGK